MCIAMNLERSQMAVFDGEQRQPDAALYPVSERVLRRRRLLFLYKVSGPAFVFFLIQSLRLGLKLGLLLNLVALLLFALSMKTLFRQDNITKASWQYISGFSVLIGFTPMIDGHLNSSVIWLLPLIPVIAAHLLGARAIVFVAFGTTLAVVGTWLASIYLDIRPEHNFQLLDKVILHQFALLVASGLGLSAIRAAKQQIQVIRGQEEELHRAQHALEAARQAKAMFLANMSHEIRTPLNGILGMTELLDAEKLEKEDRKAVRGARDCGQQLLSLLNGVLDLSKIEAEKLSLREEAYRIADVGHELESRYLEKFKALGMDFEVELADFDLELRGDRHRVVQVLSIFVQNALQFSESSLVRVASHVLREDEHDWHCWFIQDDGVGMSQELLDRVVPQRSQDLVNSAVGFHGAGLGIDLATKLISLMGGTLQLESEPGQGVSVEFRLPMLCADSGKGSEPEGPAPISAVTSLHVLLVDDNQINRRIASRLLERFNCKVVQAADGSQALDAAQAPFDLILMDLQMPVMDGLTATSKIRAEDGPNQQTPIVALSAGTFEEDQLARKKAGMSGFLCKPIDPYELERLLRAQGWVPDEIKAS